ncbi:MAG TPA: ABC-2 family transporter protein [Myxococcaceae bacterium]|nr:ABC-2 family transporter protein [Myxococcaceae bacterium]
MSLRATVRALPTMAKIGFAEAVAYRAEMLVWMLSTTMPLVMLALWRAVAQDAPVGPYDSEKFTAYYLLMFITRQLTGAWAAWQMNYEVRTGALSQRLLRPISPIAAYAMETLSALPVRSLVAVPMAVIALFAVARSTLSSGPFWALLPLALAGGWTITFLMNILIGALSLYTESSLKLMEIYFTLFAVFSGYLIPVKLFPPWLRGVVEWMPFHFQVGLPVELVTKGHEWPEALWLLGVQWGWVAVLGALTAVLWKRGLKRYAAYGG